MKHATLIGIFLGLILCQGCGEKPRIRPVANDSVVVAFGDSLTSGHGVSEDKSYPTILAELMRCRVFNEGVPGETSAEGLARLPSILRKGRIDLVILCHGGNDMLRKTNAEITQQNLDQMIRSIKAAGADVVLVGVPRPGLLLKTPELYRDLAEEHDVPLDADTVPDILSTSSLKSDHIHPNAAGYRRLAEALATLIRESTES